MRTLQILEDRAVGTCHWTGWWVCAARLMISDDLWSCFSLHFTDIRKYFSHDPQPTPAPTPSPNFGWAARNPYALANLGGELFGVDDHRALQLLEKALQQLGQHGGCGMPMMDKWFNDDSSVDSMDLWPLWMELDLRLHYFWQSHDIR